MISFSSAAFNDKEYLQTAPPTKYPSAGWPSVDQQLLLRNLLRENEYFKPVLDKIGQLDKQTVNTINEAIGTWYFELAGINKDKELFKIMTTHNADLIRCWATYAMGANEGLDIIKPWRSAFRRAGNLLDGRKSQNNQATG
ncbi:MAG: hypothetical protein JNM21_11055 [Taibaiella sp.]|nr:hypothetical protein [Taibaiella sp.]